MKPETPVPPENTNGILSMHLPSVCDICGVARNKGNHTKCSKVRQAMYAKNRETK